MSDISGRQIQRFSHSKLHHELRKRKMSTDGDIDTLKTRLIRACKRNHRRPVRQPYDYLAVIDFEATCVAKPPKPIESYIQEIIEFPIVLIDIYQQTIVDTFHSYCRPVIQPILSDFCKELTGITQEHVNKAPVFIDVFANVEKWLNERDLLTNPRKRCLFVMDSRSDFNKFLHMQCEISRITFPRWASQWNNIKTTFSRFYSIKSGRIRDMLRKLDLQFIGNLHSGLDDATNIARIALELLENGCIFEPNEYYNPFFIRPRLMRSSSMNQSNSSSMISLNCIESDAEIGYSPRRNSLHQQQRSKSRCTQRRLHHPVSRTDRTLSSSNRYHRRPNN